MRLDDQEKTVFVLDKDIYCYKVMPFGQKIAGAMYQRLVNHMFKDQLGDTIKVYIDDIFVKSKRGNNHVHHVSEAFHVLRKYDKKLNPTMCTFGVPACELLHYVVIQRGIEAKPDQIKALINI